MSKIYQTGQAWLLRQNHDTIPEMSCL